MDIPETELADLILRVARRLRRANAIELQGLPVNPHQARALRLVARLGPVRMVDLAEHLHVAARSATDVVEFLVAGGWVERVSDPSDGRARVAHLTAYGRALVADVDAARARAAEAVLGSLSTGQRSAVLDALGAAGSATDVPVANRNPDALPD